MRQGIVRKVLQTLLWLSLLGWLGLAVLLVSASYLARPLDQSEAPVQSDYIVVLGGSNDRIAAGAEYYHLGYAPRVIFSDRGKYAHFMARCGQCLGIPKEACLVDDSPKRGTLDHPKGIRNLLGEEKVRTASFLVVTDWYHTRRAKATFAKSGFGSVRVCEPLWQRRGGPRRFGFRTCWENFFVIYHEWVGLLVRRY